MQVDSEAEPGQGGAPEQGDGATDTPPARGAVAVADPPRPVPFDAPPPSRWTRIGAGGPDGGARLLGVLLLAALVGVCLALAVLAALRAADNAARASEAAAAYTPPPAPKPAAPTTVVTVIGDAASGASTGSTAWPALLAAQLKVTVHASGTPGEGYLTKGAGGATFVTDAAKVSPTSTVVVIAGGASDSSHVGLKVVQAESKALDAVRARAPRAKIVVVGPTSTATSAPQALLRLRDAELTAAIAAKARFVDPISSKWFSGQSGVTGPGGVPTDKGQKIIEQALAAALQPLP